MKTHSCKHPKKEAVSSDYVNDETYSVEIECEKCGRVRHETHHRDGKIDISEWKIIKKDDTNK